MDSHSIPPKTSQLSGQWTGFWSDPHTRQKHQMRCTIRFINGALQGHGEDEVGTFRLEGRYDESVMKCEWVKRYSTHTVIYRGSIVGSQIEGRWNIPDEDGREGGFKLSQATASIDLESLVEKSLAQGELQDAGGFTINLTRAAELLPTNQLANPDEYMLRFVAAAVATDATYLNIEFLKPSGFRLSWDGAPLERTHLELLLTGSFNTDPHISELAIGLGAAAVRYPLVEIRTQGGLLRINKGQLHLDSAQTSSEPTVVEMTKPTWFGWLIRLRAGPEIIDLIVRAGYCGLRLTLPWGDQVLPAPVQAAILAFGRTPTGTPTVISSREPDPRIGKGYLLLGEPSQVTLIHLGVSYRLGGALRGVPGHLVWWHDGLLLDLSRSGPVRNSAYQDWSEWVADTIEREMRKAIKRIPSYQVLEDCQEWMERRNFDFGTQNEERLNQRAEQNIRRGRYREALEDFLEASSLDRKHLAMVAVCLGLLGRFEEARKTYQRAIDYMPGQAWIHSNFAEDLALEGNHYEALRQVNLALSFDSNHSHALALKASFLSATNPEAAIHLAEQALANSDYPASVWETLAKIHRKRNNLEATRDSLRKFLDEADPATLWENNLPDRLESARKQLHEIPFEEAF